MKNNYDLIKYLTFLFLILFFSNGFSQNTEEKQFVIKKTSWEIFKDTIFVTKSHNGNSVPPTIEITLSDGFDFLNVLIENNSEEVSLIRTISIHCDTSKAAIELKDFNKRSSPFLISKRKFRRIYSQCKDSAGAIIYTDSINPTGLLIAFFKIKRK